jgi:hypothetical protein
MKSAAARLNRVAGGTKGGTRGPPFGTLWPGALLAMQMALPEPSTDVYRTVRAYALYRCMAAADADSSDGSLAARNQMDKHE